MRIVLASHNQGKVDEIQTWFQQRDIMIISQSEFKAPDIEETGLSFVENAILKARHACAITKLPAISDDSGLVIDVLNGEPGIYSARYAGTHGDFAKNNELVLTKMHEVPDEKRGARFVSVMVYLRHEHDPLPFIATGIWEGSILHALQGNKGFGYDPIFWVPTHACSAAELDMDEKNRISHRGQALRQLHDFLVS